ncbi:MAG: DUF3365 domain-containing protein [Candidatus Korobacteraceae bacterium]
MGEWLESLPVGWMALVVSTLTYLTAWAIFAVVTRFAAGERTAVFKGISPGMLPPLGIIFGLLVAFVASQVWNDIDHAKAAVNREASELSTVVFLAASFPGEPEARLRELTRRHIHDAVTYEWPMMAEQSASLAVTPVALAEELQVILAVTPHSEGQVTAQREIVTALEGAIEARRQRIIVSRSSVNWVKWTALLLQAMCTLVAIAMIHVHNRGAAAAALGIFATGVAVSILLIASHDRPFTGEISVSPDLLERIMPEEAATQDAIDHTVLLHLTTLLHAARQVVSDQLGKDNRKTRKDVNGAMLIDLVKAKFAEHSGRPVPNLDPTSAEGQMLKAEMDAMQEVMDEIRPLSGGPHLGLKECPPAVFASRVAERFNQKVGQLGYAKLTASADRGREKPNSPDAWEDHTIKSKFQSAGWKKGELVEQEAQLSGRRAYRMLIPEYYEASCMACHGESKGSEYVPAGKRKSAELGDLGGAISAAIYLK